jgi:NAD(P)H-hydrate epimerase
MSGKGKVGDCISSGAIRALEYNAEYFGVSLLQLMENAGGSVAQEIASRFDSRKCVVFFCGLGGNGGDGFVAARHLLSRGYHVSVILAGRGRDIYHSAAVENWKALQFLQKSVPVTEVYDSSIVPEVEADVVVDALLGTGSKGKLRPPISQLVECMNGLRAFKVAVDVPTGLDSDSGEALGPVMKADLTITFYRQKFGLRKAKRYVGEIVVRDIGLPSQVENFAGPGDVLVFVGRRSSEVHKGDSGRLLSIGGSKVFSGAPTLVSLAALRTGVDIVYLAAPEKTAMAISSMSPDLITIKLEGEDLNPKNVETLKPYIDKVDAVVLGPGLGLEPETKEFVKECIDAVEKAGKPLLLDADGLKAFGSFKRPLEVPLILTPHAGEYAVLTGRRLFGDLDADVEAVQQTARELDAVILLKGPVDAICSGSRFKLNFTGNAGMTVGGTGDVLSGVVGGLLAQKVDAFEAAVAGAFVNGAAGDFVANSVGFHMVASDLLSWIPTVLDNPMDHLRVRKT